MGGLFFCFFVPSWLVLWEDEHFQISAPAGGEAREGTGSSGKSSLLCIKECSENQTAGATGQGAGFHKATSAVTLSKCAIPGDKLNVSLCLSFSVTALPSGHLKKMNSVASSC